MAVHAKAPPHGGGRSHEIGLNGACDLQRISAFGLGSSNIKLKLPDLIAAKSDASTVITLDP
jgi:hypothetical protein